MRRALSPATSLAYVTKTGAAYKDPPASPARSSSPSFPLTSMCVGGTPLSFGGSLHAPHRSVAGEAATAVSAIKGGKVVGIVVTNAGSGYADVSCPSTSTRGTAVMLTVLVV